MNIDHTITFETVINEALLAEDGTVILPREEYDSYVVRLFNLDAPNEDGAPFIYQPFNHLNGSQPFATEVEAQEWVDWYKASFQPEEPIAE
jgi:hypothetical protein